MSKRTIAILCVLIMAVTVLTACGGNPLSNIIPQPDNSSSAASTVSSAASSAPASSAPASSAAESAVNNAGGSDASASSNSKVSEGIKVEPIVFSNDYSTTLYLLMSNDSGKDCDLDINVDFFNADGKIVGTTSGSVDAVAKGTTVCEDFYCDEEFTTYEYKVVASDLSYYIPVDQDLAVDVSELTNKVIVSLTNNGKIPARYVWYDVFFYKNGKLVDHNYSYCEDNDSEIKPGATERSECSFWGDDGYDEVKVYFHGEGDADN